jgi:hypothetical protein
MAGIQELRDFTVMAFSHGPSATEDRFFLALAEHALRRTDAVKAVATRSRPRVAHPRRAQPRRVQPKERTGRELGARRAPARASPAGIDAKPE